MSKLTVLDLGQALVWAIIGFAPLLNAYVSGENYKEGQKGVSAVFFWIAVIAQVGLCIALFKAGGK